MTDERIAEEIFKGILSDLSILRKVPVATYRLQFQRAFTFSDAKRLVPYLYALGITDCYTSPYLQAASGSSHGYDITDHNRLNPELGSEKEYAEFVEELKRYEMGQILDLVPNHMGIAGNNNAWWLDVLENGPSSHYSSYFDIDWTPVKAELKNKALLPILGDQYGKVLENQELTLTFQEGAFTVWYHGKKLPIAPGQYTQILRHRLDTLSDQLGRENHHLLELQSIITAFDHLPPPTEKDPERLVERRREKEITKKRLFKLYSECPEVKEFIDENIRIFNGKKGDPRSFDLLDALLAAQVYRLAYWRVAAEEINFRRFFDINELAAIRMEDPAVFQETHKLIFRLIRERKVTGLRIDHPDGLYEPGEYFRGLQRGVFLTICQDHFDAKPERESGNWKAVEEILSGRYDEAITQTLHSPLNRAFYIVAEKILTRGEKLPEDWSVDGTTGYEFLNRLNGIFVDASNAKAFNDLYSRYIHTVMNFQDLIYEKKKLIMHVSMSSEINVLGHRLNRISEKNRLSRDFTLNSLTDALREIIACFPVYRTYLGEGDVRISEADRVAIERAVARAKRKNPTTNVSIFNFIRDILCSQFPEHLGEHNYLEQRDFRMKFQQITGPVMAKGVEDTAFYVYNRLVSLNEVGGDPERFGVSPASFHRDNGHQREAWPYSMLATSTHDTKRSEDVRARINVLSEVSDEWKARLVLWSKLNKKRKPLVDDQPAPDRNEEYLLYQTLLGTWPLEPMNRVSHEAYKERIQQYMEKAIKEAKVNSSWVNPNKDYDEAVRNFVSAILDDSQRNPFLDDFKVFARKIAAYGIYNSLSQTLLKIASPGVPDIYQGNEIWDFSLVDPDNRGPVDYKGRSQMLKALQDRISGSDENLIELAKELVAQKEDGRIKLFVIWKALTFRRENRGLFLDGAYLALEGTGSKKDHICSFARRNHNQVILAVVPRFLSRLTQSPEEPPLGKTVWLDSSLAVPDSQVGQTFRNIFTGETVKALESEGSVVLPLKEIFASFPVALLELSS